MITSRDVDGTPQFGAQIQTIEANPTLPDDHFRFTPPEDAERIDFLPVAEGAVPTPTGEEVTP